MGETMPTKQSAAEMAAEVLALRAQLSEKDREIERLKAKDEDHRELRVQFRKAMDALESSQAREREAVTALAEARERAERADQSVRSMVEKQFTNIQEQHDWEVVSLRLSELEEGHMSLESALAAARKALEDLLGWFMTPCHPGEPAMKAMVPVRELARYRAALNGDSHTAHDATFQGLRDAILGTPEPPKEDSHA